MYSWLLRISIGFVALVFLLGIFAYGIVVQRYKLWPYEKLAEIQTAATSIKRSVTGENQWQDFPVAPKRDKAVNDFRLEPRQPGLNLVSGGNREQLSIRIVDMSGTIVHEWLPDWYELVPDDSYLPEAERPKGRPGTMVHGAVLMPNGDVIFNFETKALIRLDPDGNVVWRQKYLTHHSLEIGPNGFLWAPLERRHPIELDPRFPDLKPEFSEAIVARIDPETGRILEEISVYDILIENDLRSVLYLGRGDPNNRPTGDIVHLNDVEVFHGATEEGVFQPGDIMVSLRNVSTIVVFDPKMRKVRHHWIAANFINQHDPDFIDANRIAIYDNNPIGADTAEEQSRIVIADARGGMPEVWYAGTDSESEPFYNLRMGMHQRLGNGHFLVIETDEGRAFELDNTGNIVWEFYNLFDDGKSGAIWGISRLPEWASTLFAE